MRLSRHGLAALLLLALGAAAHATEGRAPLVAVGSGYVRGFEADGVREFRGIPYAVPPLGALRWRAPLPAPPWRGVREARQYRSACPQVIRFKATEASDDEDCLYLNVATPVDAGPARRKPVIVWIHGGAFVGGGANLYPTAHWVRRSDVVLVAINYRLGALGFIVHPAFDSHDRGGYALEDQRLALRWVRRNIAAFGGDPRNVTIAGESAGAASVCLHLVAPTETKALFHKAIIQSAGCAVALRSVREAMPTGLELARRLGCDEPASAAHCLRAAPLARILDAQTAIAAADYQAFWPSVGGPTVPEEIRTALDAGRFVRVPILNGGTRDEMRMYLGYEVADGAVIDYAARLRKIYGEHAAEVAAEYPLPAATAPAAALGRLMSDYTPFGGLNNCLFLETARLASRFVPVYEYEFSDAAAPPVTPDPGFEMGAVHSSELPYFFPRFSSKSIPDARELEPASQALSDRMLDAWSAFARSGSPNPDGGVGWPRYTGGAQVMRLEPGRTGPFDAESAHHCAFWRRLYPELH
jgi:para-nitrobenzyl esterase